MIVYRLEQKNTCIGPYSLKLSGRREYLSLFPTHIDYYQMYICNRFETNIDGKKIVFSLATLKKINKIGNIFSSELRDYYFFSFKNVKAINNFIKDEKLRKILIDNNFHISKYETDDYISFPDNQVVFNKKTAIYREKISINI